MKFVPWFAMSFVILLTLAGVIVDGGGKTQTMQQALTISQSAARAGTNSAVGNSVSGDAFDLSTPMAVTAAQNYLTSAGVSGTVTVSGDTVTVTVRMVYEPKMLTFLGDLPVEATGTARLIGN